MSNENQNVFRSVVLAVAYTLPILIAGLIGSAIDGCSPAKTAAGISAGINEATCILDHDDEPPEQIVKDCAEVTLEGVKKIIAANHRSAARRAAASASAAPSSSTSK